MNSKLLLRAMTLILALLAGFSAPTSLAAEHAAPAIELASNQSLKVYYFHGHVRCTTCRKFERYTSEAVTQRYAQAIAQERLELRIVNVERAENEHFIQDFELITRTVVLALEQDGKVVKWQRLDKAWSLLGEQSEFTDYLCSEMARFTA